MAPIVDDLNGVDPAQIAIVQKPDTDDAWWLRVTTTSGTTVRIDFLSQNARDEFYKRLVNAIGG